MSAALDTDRIALSAVSEPKLMADSSSEMTRQRTSWDMRQRWSEAPDRVLRRGRLTAFTGMSHPGRTHRIQDEKGKPLSRLNAHICREELAMVVTVEKYSRTTSTLPSTMVPACDWVVL